LFQGERRRADRDVRRGYPARPPLCQLDDVVHVPPPLTRMRGGSVRRCPSRCSPSRAGGPAADHLACVATAGWLFRTEGGLLRAHARPPVGVTLRTCSAARRQTRGTRARGRVPEEP